MLYIIGFGLSSPQDLSLRALSILRRCSKVYIDSYTSFAIDPYSMKNFKELLGQPIIEADRKIVEQGTDILVSARGQDVAFVVVGDPFSATTHIDLVQRAIIEDIPFETVNNTSIMTVVGQTGLCLYEFGRTVSIPFWDEFGCPDSFYEKIEMNLGIGTHTLCLLDIKVKEQSLDNLIKGNDIYEPAKYMTFEKAAQQLYAAISKLEDSGKTPYVTLEHLILAVARLGSPDQKMAIGTLNTFFQTLRHGPSQLNDFMGAPLHSIIVLGPLQASEKEHFTHSVVRMRSNRHQPVFFMSPNRIAQPVDAKQVLRIIDNHNILCKAIIEKAKPVVCPPVPEEKPDGDSECEPTVYTYKPRLL